MDIAIALPLNFFIIYFYLCMRKSLNTFTAVSLANEKDKLNTFFLIIIIVCSIRAVLLVFYASGAMQYFVCSHYLFLYIPQAVS